MITLQSQKNAKQAADRRFVDALQGCHLTEEFVLSKAARSAASATELRSDGGTEGYDQKNATRGLGGSPLPPRERR